MAVLICFNQFFVDKPSHFGAPYSWANSFGFRRVLSSYLMTSLQELVLAKRKGDRNQRTINDAYFKSF